MLKFSDFFIYRLGLPAAILVGAAAPHTKFLLGLALGEAWVTFGMVFLFLAVAAVFQVLTYMATWLAMATMSGKEILRTSGIAKVPAVIAIVASSPFGTEAVAGTLAATQVVTWLVFSLSNAKVMKVKAFQTLLSGFIVITTLGLVALLSFLFSSL
jgi:O-antigen/teichoic acid export membrane protein